MDGPTHRKLAPVFTAGSSYLILAAQNQNPSDMVAAVGIASAVSILAANWADADLYASRPFPAIWAGTKVGAVGGVRRARVKTPGKGKPRTVYLYKKKRYTKVRKLSMRIWASFFRVIGVRGHRVWQSHSPVIWVPVFTVIYIGVLNKVNSSGTMGMLGLMISSVPLGIGLGYISHLAGDLLTYRGLPLLPEMKMLWKIPILGGIIKFINNLFSDIRVARFSFSKASNKRWNSFVVMLFIFITVSIISPEISKTLIQVTWGVIKKVSIMMWDTLTLLTSNYKG